MNEEKSQSQTDTLVSIDSLPAPSIHGAQYDLKKWAEHVDHNLEVMASILARGITTRRIQRAAQKLGVPASSLKIWLKDPRVIKRAAVYGTALGLSAQVQKAKEGDLSAFKAIAQVGGMIESGGPKVLVNTAIDNRTVGNNESDKGFFQQFRKRVEKRIESVEP